MWKPSVSNRPSGSTNDSIRWSRVLATFFWSVITLPSVARAPNVSAVRRRKRRDHFMRPNDRAPTHDERRAASRRAAARGPIEPLFEPVVAPEHLAVCGHETWRAEDSDLRRASALGLELRLDGVALGAFKCRDGHDAAFFQQRAERRTVADRQALTKFGDKDPSREIGALGALKRERHPRGEQTRLWKRLGALERNAQGAARPLEVAPHVAPLGRIDVKRRIAPALRHEDRPEQERPPDKAHVSLICERGDAKRRRIGIGARELVPELGARHMRLL